LRIAEVAMRIERVPASIPSMVVPLDPARIVDTRSANGVPSATPVGLSDVVSNCVAASGESMPGVDLLRQSTPDGPVVGRGVGVTACPPTS